MTRVGVVTQARTTSTRLPAKVLIPLAGRSVLEHHLHRLRAGGLEPYVATTTNATDDPVVSLARSLGVAVHRGSEHDVLDRFDGCAREHGLDVVVRVTSDCPLVDGHLVADAVERWLREDDPYLYLSNTLERTFPRGFDFEVFSARALHEAAERAVEPWQREHVTPYLYADAEGRMRLENVGFDRDASRFRVTLDTEADLSVVRRLVEEFGAHELSCAEIVAVLEEHPEIARLNEDVEQKKLRDSG